MLEVLFDCFYKELDAVSLFLFMQDSVQANRQLESLKQQLASIVLTNQQLLTNNRELEDRIDATAMFEVMYSAVLINTNVIEMEEKRIVNMSIWA